MEKQSNDRGFKLLLGAIAVVLVIAVSMLAQARTPADRAQPTPATRVDELNNIARGLEFRAADRRPALYFELLDKSTGPQAILNRDRDIRLVAVDGGRPRFYTTDNLVAAQSVGADQLWPGGSTGLGLTGANSVGHLAIWDGGLVMDTHQEFGGRVSVGDGATSVHYHATHVGGTMIAAGVDPAAKGMSNAAYLVSYDWIDDESEMAIAAGSGTLISNHSYGYATGWRYSSTDTAWFWYGDVDVSEVEDNGFGIYIEDCRVWDEIVYNAPDYLIVKSAGNDRNDDGPGPGGEHYYWDNYLGEWTLSTVTRNADGFDNGFDTISYKGNSKNILTVGAVNDVTGGWTQASDVIMSTFSGWGPTDDGRIKPDLVANGVSLYSAYVNGDDSYASFSGTSMSSPNASGAIHLLAQQWRALQGYAAKSATLKALAIHTTDETGDYDGPDYAFGWGLLNAARAGEMIAAHAVDGGSVVESQLAQGERDTFIVFSDGSEPLLATVCWTDPATVTQSWELDPTTSVLVNDLDIRMQRVSDSVTFFPWVLDPADPAAAATNWDNSRDNVEKVEIPVVPSGFYRVMVSHKGTLTNASQDYSLVMSGWSEPAVPPVVSNVTFAQRLDGSGLVDIGYDVEDVDSPTLTTWFIASSDGGASWNLVTTTATGDLGAGIVPGTGKTIVWDFAADNPDVFAADAIVRVWAED